MVKCNDHSMPPSFMMFGYAIPDSGFFGMVGESELVVAPPPVLNATVIQVQSVEVSTQLTEDELCQWGVEGWDWQV